MLRPRAALGPLAVVGNKPARAAEAGIDAFPWHGTTTWQSRKVRGMPFVVLQPGPFEVHLRNTDGKTGYVTGRAGKTGSSQII